MIQVDYKSRKPIYEQIRDNIKRLVIQGALLPDSQLPSVRQLAGQLSINPNTIQKAYSELERDGTIYALAGRGNFISADIEKLLEGKKEELNKKLKNLISEAVLLGIDLQSLIYQVKKTYEEVKVDD